jgi:hypothetical protein
VNPFPPFATARVPDDADLLEDEPHRSRTPLIALGVVALAAVVAAVAVLAVVLISPRPTPQAGTGTGTSPGATVSSAPTASRVAPSDVKLRDDGNSITLTWTDPSDGTVPFFVEVGKPGAQLQLYNTLPRGETTYRVVGLNPRLDYCFSVIAVYGTDAVAPSNLVCTQRNGNSGASPGR